MQERGVAASANVAGHGAHQRGRQALAAMARVGADSADLGPAGWVQPLADHRDQRAAAPYSDIAAEYVGPGLERARLGASDQLDHLGGVRRAESNDLLRRGLVGPQRVGGDQLNAGALEHHVPSGGDLSHPTRERHHSSRSDESMQVRPDLLVDDRRDRDDRRDIRRVAQHPRGPFGQVSVRTGERSPGGVIQRMRPRVGGPRGGREQVNRLELRHGAAVSWSVAGRELPRRRHSSASSW